jgi:hypothetical protein
MNCFQRFVTPAMALVIVSIAKPANACSDVLSTIVATALRPVIESTNVCRDLKQRVSTPLGAVTVGVDKTEKVELRALQYCPSPLDSILQASIFVRCSTSDAALIRLSIDETFELHLQVRNSNCEVLDMSVIPRGEIGRLIVGLTGFSDQIKQAAAQHIQVLCR